MQPLGILTNKMKYEGNDAPCGSMFNLWVFVTKVRSLFFKIQFLPEPCTNGAGREIAVTSFMGPFLSVSIFAEDDPSVADKFFSNNSVTDRTLNFGLQRELDSTRVSLPVVYISVDSCSLQWSFVLDITV